MKGYMYILECCDGSYYTGSTKNLEVRLAQHQAGEGANHTKKRLPVKLVYYEEYQRIDVAFYREKQVQGWSRKKKEALIRGEFERLPELAIAYRDVASRASATEESINSDTPATEESINSDTPATEESINSDASATEESMKSDTSATEKPLPEALEGNVPKT